MRLWQAGSQMGGVCYWHLGGRSKDAAKPLPASLANLGVYTYLPEWCVSFNPFGSCCYKTDVPVSVVQLWDISTNCWPLGKTSPGQECSRSSGAGRLNCRSASGMGPPCEKTAECRRPPCTLGSLSEALLFESGSSFNFFFDKVHWPLLICQISHCSYSLKIKDIKN